MPDQALYVCRAMHRRPGPPRYRFSYRSFYLLLDVDAINAACAATPLLSRNRFNLLSFHDVDHGPHDGRSLRAWAEATLADYGVDLDGGRIRLLTMPRVLGYGFNPISVFYCEHADHTLRAIVAEVHNTFGEHHFYVLHDQGAALDWGKARTKAKRFHVSPFLERAGAYRFRFARPGQQLSMAIRLYDRPDAQASLRVATTLTGRCLRITTRNVLRVCLQMPLMSLKVIGAIHWQALKIWLRGGHFHRKPKAGQRNIS